MIAARESANDGLRNCYCVELFVGKGDDLVVDAVIKEHGTVHGEALRKICARFDVVARPAAFTDERGSNEEYAAEPRGRQVLCQDVNQDRGANRVAHENGTVFELVELAE